MLTSSRWSFESYNIIIKKVDDYKRGKPCTVQSTWCSKFGVIRITFCRNSYATIGDFNSISFFQIVPIRINGSRSVRDVRAPQGPEKKLFYDRFASVSFAWHDNGVCSTTTTAAGLHNGAVISKRPAIRTHFFSPSSCNRPDFECAYRFSGILLFATVINGRLRRRHGFRTI